MTDAERAARGLRPLDRTRLRELIGFYSRVEIRNIAEFGRDSAGAAAAGHILRGLQAVKLTSDTPSSVSLP